MLEHSGLSAVAKLRSFLEHSGEMDLSHDTDPAEVAARLILRGNLVVVVTRDEVRLLSEPTAHNLIDPLRPIDPRPGSPAVDPDAPEPEPSDPSSVGPSVLDPHGPQPGAADPTQHANQTGELPGADTATSFLVFDKHGHPLIGTFEWVLDGRVLGGSLDEQIQDGRSVQSTGEVALELQALALPTEEDAHG